ncbi:hypothetical protein C1T31_10455 [Hanstruepera neustonica]|uniref:Uncharacterized protein n=1 Tax=Hanstruepera neustonica TaxID=1445657 RepID=A0A2K1DX15_9FLAO|nr:hypothetical protein [Hanstruepera neustonica]PNQ72568.1 hypothetical protein C1T31_10455 [Hanstruepera neustonica]
MTKPIRIVDDNIELELYTGIFGVYVLGGWDVVVDDFTFDLTNTETGRIIKPKGTQWRLQSYEFGKRAKKIMTLDIPEKGNYLVEFKNQNSLKVWKASLPIINRLINQPIEKQWIQILIK